jgi:acylphosphatase
VTDSDQNNLAAVHMYASGRVQGVGFRYFVTRRATELGITGFVRNTSDGRVEVRAEGPKSDLETLEQAVQSGPHLGSVTEIDVRWMDPTGNYVEFRATA